MIAMGQALQKVNQYLAALEKRSSHKLVVLERSTREEDFGWIFFYNSKEFVETGNTDFALGGNAPLIVDRHSGELHETGTAFPIERYIAAYRKYGHCRDVR